MKKRSNEWRVVRVERVAMRQRDVLRMEDVEQLPREQSRGGTRMLAYPRRRQAREVRRGLGVGRLTAEGGGRDAPHVFTLPFDEGPNARYLAIEARRAGVVADI